jgi:RNA polymerase sigma factor (sigma-70 family)
MYERYSARIHRVCADRLGDRDEAADAVQDTFLKAWLALRNGAEVRYPLPWLLTIADNVCVSRYRARDARVATTALTDGATVDFSEAVGDVDGLAAAFKTLPLRQRQALLRREVQGFSYDEIGAELGVSRASVAALLHRARLAVADTLREARRGIAALVPIPAVLRAPFEHGAASGAAVAGTAVIAVTQLAGAGPVSPSQSPPAQTTDAITVLASPSSHVLATARPEPKGGSRALKSRTASAAEDTGTRSQDARSGAQAPPGDAVAVLGATSPAPAETTSADVPVTAPAEPEQTAAVDPETAAPPAAADEPPPAEPAPTSSPKSPSRDADGAPGKKLRGERVRSEHAPGREGKPERMSPGSKEQSVRPTSGPDDKTGKGIESSQPAAPGKSQDDPPPAKPDKGTATSQRDPAASGVAPDETTNEGTKNVGHPNRGKPGDEESPKAQAAPGGLEPED